MVTQERLKELFTCDWGTGIFTRLVHTNNNGGTVGSMAGCTRPEGYVVINVDGKSYRAHRLVWLYFFGEWPEYQLDHIDGNKSNNSMDNLREASHIENSRNKGKQTNNTSGYIGVSWHRGANKFMASIKIEGKQKYLGIYNTAEEASKVYNDKAKEIFGEFYNGGSECK